VSVKMKVLLLLLLAVALLAVATQAVILTPPYFNLAAGRRIYATATCGEEIQEPELYCKLVGANADRDVNVNLIQGQVSCDTPLGFFKTVDRLDISTALKCR
jgi:laminin alpha 3/5